MWVIWTKICYYSSWMVHDIILTLSERMVYNTIRLLSSSLQARLYSYAILFNALRPRINPKCAQRWPIVHIFLALRTEQNSKPTSWALDRCVRNFSTNRMVSCSIWSTNWILAIYKYEYLLNSYRIFWSVNSVQENTRFEQKYDKFDPCGHSSTSIKHECLRSGAGHVAQEVRL